MPIPFCVVWKKYAKAVFSLAGGLCLLVLTGCLPEDTYLAIRFSPDGGLLAIVSEKQGLLVADPERLSLWQIASGAVDPSNIAWTEDSGAVAYSASNAGSPDIFLTSLDGLTTRVTSTPAREYNPMIHNGVLYYLSTESGRSEITSHTVSRNDKGTRPRLAEVDQAMHAPVLSPDGDKIAAYGFEDMRPQIYCLDLRDGGVDQLTSETDPFSLVMGSIAWGSNSNTVGFLRAPVIDEPSDDDFYNTDVAALEGALEGKFFNARYLDKPGQEQTLVRSSDGIRGAQFAGNGSVVFASGKNLVLATATGTDRVLSMDLPAALPRTGGDQDQIAYVAANQLIGITSSSLEVSHILTFDLEDKFLLAEEYFRSGSPSKSYALYEELAASVQRTRDPKLARFVYIANLRRLGRTDKAVREIEEIIAAGQEPESVPQKYLWRLLGFSYLLELDDLEKAASSFERYRELTSASQEMTGQDSALNALDIIQNTPPEVAQVYGRAVKARLDGNFMLTDQLFGDLLTTASHLASVQREYINALGGFDKEVYYFSPSQRPFRPSKSQRAEYLQRFVDSISTASLPARDARLELFLMRIEMGSYSRARNLLSEALTSAPKQGKPDGILEVFRNYLETPEPQPWINQAMPEVFLHNDIRPRLERLITEPADRLLLAVAATKVAVLLSLPDQARQEANAATTEWNRIPAAEQSGDNAELYGRLLVLRAREAELRGLYAEAAAAYDQALNLLSEKRVDNFEMQEEIRYRASLLRMLIADYPDMPEQMRNVELRTGVELINPTWEYESLEGAVRDYLGIYDTTSSTLKQWTAYECGILFSKLRRPYQARAALMMTAADSSPDFMQRKAMLELAAIDEYTGDPWNAAAWYSRLSGLPEVSHDVRLWCSYQIARLHLSINYKTQAAREALAVIVSTRPEGPLAIRAQELLISTSTR